MLFIAGLERLTRDEKVLLAAQITALTGWNILSEGAQKTARKVKSFVLKSASRLTKLASKEYARQLDELDQRSDWDVEIIQRKISEEVKSISRYSDEALTKLLREKIAYIAEIKPDVDDEVLANAVLHRAAKATKVDVRYYPDAVRLEGAVFEACVREQMDELKKRLERMTLNEEVQFESILRSELEKLSQADREALKKAVGLDEVSAGALLNLLKTTSGVALTQLFLGGFGFGAFLFLTTMIKAFSLLLGLTLSFGVYTAATTMLAFLLSAPFFLLVVFFSGTLILRNTSRQIDDQLAKILVVAGKGNLLIQP